MSNAAFSFQDPAQATAPLLPLIANSVLLMVSDHLAVLFLALI